VTDAGPAAAATVTDDPAAAAGIGVTDDTAAGAGAVDTAGTPWAGRELAGQPFAGDHGHADRALVQALAAAAAGTVGTRDVVRALAAARVLVPVVAVSVVAVSGEDHSLRGDLRGDLGAEMATVTITGADGRVALPVFSSVQTLGRWDPAARPVPVQAARAALSAVDQGCELLVLDAAGPRSFVVPRPAVWAIGQGREWTPPGSDDDLLAALRAAVRPLPDVLGLRCEQPASSPDTGLRIVLGVRAGLARPDLTAVTRAATALIAEVDLLAERADAVELKVLPA
jgi:SseB protein N-terminal domain